MNESRPAAPPGYRLSSTPSPPLSPAAAERMLNSDTWESRAEVALQDTVAPEHIVYQEHAPLAAAHQIRKK